MMHFKYKGHVAGVVKGIERWLHYLVKNRDVYYDNQSLHLSLQHVRILVGILYLDRKNASIRPLAMQDQTTIC